MVSERELGILKDLVAQSPLALRQRPRTSANVRDNATASSGARPDGRKGAWRVWSENDPQVGKYPFAQ